MSYDIGLRGRAAVTGPMEHEMAHASAGQMEHLGSLPKAVVVGVGAEDGLGQRYAVLRRP